MPVKVMVLIKRKAGITPEAFQKYYESNHAPLAMELVGPRFAQYIRNFVADSSTTGDDLGFDVITELWFKDQGQYDGFYADLKKEQEGQNRITKDEEAFIDRAALKFFKVKEAASACD